MSKKEKLGVNTSKNGNGIHDELNEQAYEPVEVSIKNLITAGAHFGHKTEKWNPKMVPYIFGAKSGVHIINLDKTLESWLRARKYIQDISARGGSVLLVGTKHQAVKLIESAAKRSGSPYVNKRWLGGTLTNFETIKNSIRRMHRLEDLLAKAQIPGSEIKIAKKERVEIAKRLTKLDANLGGIKDMKKLPDVLFIIDIKKEFIAVLEARKLKIPVIALVDTNVDPGAVQMPIPSNDDAFNTIKLFVDAVADAVIEGKAEYETTKSKKVSKKEKDAEVIDSEEEKKDSSAAASA